MKIEIIEAVDQEIKILKKRSTNTMSWERADAPFVFGSLRRYEMVVVRSGIGKVASAMTTTSLIHQYGISMVVNTGPAGSIDEGLKVDDLVIAGKLAYFDVDITGFGYAYGQLPGGVPLYFRTSEYLRIEIVKTAKKTGLAIRKELIVTGDTFVDSAKKIIKIKGEFPKTLVCEMKGTAVGQAASRFNILFLVVRAVSDTADDEATQSFDEFIGEAGRKSAEMVIHFVENLVQKERGIAIILSIK